MKFFLLFACLVASAAGFVMKEGMYGLPSNRPPPNGGYRDRVAPTSGNPAEIAALFPDLDPPVATAIAEALIGAGIGMPIIQKTVLEADPEIVWTAIEIMLKTMLATVPTGCKDAVATHAVAGIARHIIMEVLIKDYIHIVEECTEKARIHGAMAARTRAAGRGDVPTLAEWTALIDQLKTAIDGKLAAWIPATETVHLEEYFGAIMTEIDLVALKDAPIATVLAKIASADQDLVMIFQGTATTCEVTGSIGEITPHVTELATFLTTDVLAIINNADIPPPAKPIITKKLKDTLEMVADDLKGLIQAYSANNVVAFIVEIMREIKEEIAIASGVGRIINSIVTPDLITFVKEKVSAGETEKFLKGILRTVALTLADLDLPEPEIEMFMTTIIKMVTGDSRSMYAISDRFFSFGAYIGVSW